MVPSTVNLGVNTWCSATVNAEFTRLERSCFSGRFNIRVVYLGRQPYFEVLLCATYTYIGIIWDFQLNDK